MKRTRLKREGTSEVATLKREIQRLVREIVMKRDGGCILRGVRGCSDPVLQADHLITRANSATYDDTRLIVCVCRSCHGWKKWHQHEYEYTVRTMLPAARIRLWDRCEKDSWRPTQKGAYNWRVSVAALKQELQLLTGAESFARDFGDQMSKLAGE